MKIIEIAQFLNARIFNETNLDRHVVSACGADLMSDVLAFVKHNTLLLTGLMNQHVVRTAEMVDIACVVFVRGKQPTEDICALANEKGITLLATDASMFEACGILYNNGLPACMNSEEK
jgi:predicted transcriptional regulator